MPGNVFQSFSQRFEPLTELLFAFNLARNLPAEGKKKNNLFSPLIYGRALGE